MLQRSFLCLALAAAPLLAQEAPPQPAPAAPTVRAGEMTVQALAELWAGATGSQVTVDPQAGMVTIRFATETVLEREVLRSVLGFNDVVLTEEAGGRFQLHHRRNLAQRLPVASPVIKDRAPEGDQLVTWVAYVRHGAGNAIFATLRGFMARDTNRIGNALYVPGPEALVIADLAPQLRYYQELVAQLDVPRPSTALTMRVLELPRARWSALCKQAAGEALVRALEAEAGVVELESATLDLAGEGFKLSRELVGPKGQAAQVRLEVGPPAGGGESGAPRQLAQGEVLLRLDVASSDGQGGGVTRRLEQTLPALLGSERILVQGFAGREGDAPTQLVLVLTTRPRE